MEDTEVLDWIRGQATGACRIFSVCTGALLCGAAGLLKGRRATTHSASFHLLPLFGAIPVDERVVVNGAWVFAAGVTAGIDGALRLAAELRGEAAAQAIQLHMVYSRAALRQRDARDRARRDLRAGAAIHAGDHRSARADGSARRRPPRHCCSGGWRKPRGYWRIRQRTPH